MATMLRPAVFEKISMVLPGRFNLLSSVRASGLPVVERSGAEPTVAERINSELLGGRAGGATGRLFAVVHAAGKQRKVTVEDIIILDKPIDADVGERIRLNKVLLVGGRDFTVVGRPILSASQARVEATVIEKTLSHGKIIFWYHRRENNRYFRMRKDALTFLRINSIELNPVNP